MLEDFARRVHQKLAEKSLLVVALSVAFSPLSAAEPREALESAVKDCQFLGKIEGSSGYGKHPAGWEPLAKAHALHQAEKMGADHVVWERMITVGAFNGRAVARGYQCDNKV